MSKRRGLPEQSRMRHDAHFVDQLVRADELPIGRKIPLHLIEANPDQPRSVLGDLEDLKHSILEKGVLEPILVRPRGDGRFTIISGERRFRASLEAGLAEIPAIEMEVDDRELLEIALIENLQRKDLSPFEEADGYQALQDKHGYTHEAISKAVGKSRVTVTEALSLMKLPDSVKERCRRADIASKSFLLELRKLENERAMAEAVDAWLAGEGISRDTLRDAKKQPASKGRLEAARRAFSMNWSPEGSAYKVNLVLKGKLTSREQVLDALKDLARRIESGEVDFDKVGRFSLNRTARKPRAKK